MAFIPLMCVLLALFTPDVLGLTEDKRSGSDSGSGEGVGLAGVKSILTQLFPSIPPSLLDGLIGNAGDHGGSGGLSKRSSGSGSFEGLELNLDVLKALLAKLPSLSALNDLVGGLNMKK